jgi:dUTPase
MRIAQLVVTPVLFPETKLTEMLDETDRGTNGFGSSGIQ